MPAAQPRASFAGDYNFRIGGSGIQKRSVYGRNVVGMRPGDFGRGFGAIRGVSGSFGFGFGGFGINVGGVLALGFGLGRGLGFVGGIVIQEALAGVAHDDVLVAADLVVSLGTQHYVAGRTFLVAGLG